MLLRSNLRTTMQFSLDSAPYSFINFPTGCIKKCTPFQIQIQINCNFDGRIISRIYECVKTQGLLDDGNLGKSLFV